jgi:hypothetical protein
MGEEMRKVSLFSAAAVVLGLGLAASATTVTFNDFSSTAGLTLNGNTATAVTGDGTVLRLVPATTSQSGSAFSSVTINAATFSTAFKFRITNPGGINDGTDTGADGLVFVVQNVANNIGGGGGGMGYEGIGSSVGAEYDTWHNGWDPDSNHLGVDKNGSVTSLATQAIAPRFDDGDIWYGWVDYDGTNLEVRANKTGVYSASPDLTFAIDIPAILGSTTAYVGFTAGTGGAFGNHDLLSWEYHDEFAPPTVPLPAAAWGGLSLLGALAARRRLARK